jgi:hypothetical protein
VVDHRKTSTIRTPRGELASPEKATSPQAESTDPVLREFEAAGINDVKKIKEGVYMVNDKKFNVQVRKGQHSATDLFFTCRSAFECVLIPDPSRFTIRITIPALLSK